MSLNRAYVKSVVTWHALKQRTAESLAQFKENNTVSGKFASIKNEIGQDQTVLFNQPTISKGSDLSEQYSDNFRRKKWWELVLLSGAVCGIEFCYAAETAFVTPILLNLGLDVKLVTLIWCLSPMIGFFATPILGSLSDRCTSRFGRRRPFIVLLSIGILIGLILVPNGSAIGILLGDISASTTHVSNAINNSVNFKKDDVFSNVTLSNGDIHFKNRLQPWSILFTVIGTILLDFCSDACQSPSRTYLLDVTVPNDHSLGLSTFTMMAGLGGAVGYLMGGVNWENTILGHLFGGHIRTVFTLVAVVFIICLLLTITSFSEIPLYALQNSGYNDEFSIHDTPVGDYLRFHEELELEQNCIAMKNINYGSANSNPLENNLFEENSNDKMKKQLNEDSPTLKQYLLSIVHMPNSLKILCLTNLFCWMSLVCYSLYFTNFVGESVFGGDPQQPQKTKLFLLYEEGVRYGCYGMALYSISCTFYSYHITSLIQKFGAKKVYVGGQLIYSLGMAIMALCRHKIAVLLLSPTAGFMYATLFTMPYLLVAHYHCMHKFEIEDEQSLNSSVIRGIGTDVAIVSSMVFLSQFLLSLSMGSLVSLVGSSTVTVCTASFLSACGALCATQVHYLDL